MIQNIKLKGAPFLLIIQCRCLKLHCVNVSLCLLPPPSSDFHGELQDCLKFPLNPQSKTTICKPNKGHNITHVEQFDCKKEENLVAFGCKTRLQTRVRAKESTKTSWPVNVRLNEEDKAGQCHHLLLRIFDYLLSCLPGDEGTCLYFCKDTFLGGKRSLMLCKSFSLMWYARWKIKCVRLNKCVFSNGSNGL